MKVNELVERLDLRVLNPGAYFEDEITGGYASDLLSDVMGNVGEGMIWITLQVHRNIVAVASLREVGAVLLVNGAEVETETLELARSEQVTLLSTPMSSFEASGRIYGLLKSGK